MRITCLHTADSNIAVFENTARALGLDQHQFRHVSRPDLLAAAEKAGGLTAEILQQTADVLLALSENTDRVLLTCSTLGPAATLASKSTTVPVLRVDQALAEQAMKTAGNVVALCAVETTLEPTRQLFAQVERHPQARLKTRLVAGAWEKFKQGDLAGYLQAIAVVADAEYKQGAACVVLAQASMTGAAQLTQMGKPLTSPECGLRAALA
ncbi:Asp/Glu racemase [Rahnella sp. SL6]|uniref:aspartate/glutamate racemase family protein n=1 Tax=Rahnella perminowiae TaxID=2816244 RepID=UPI001C27FF59|nr:aspartate/glutamate racemase family protein [Rahnella perminowiae]MBU9809990.1 Asp/Glu racemase [Rahnella perminowiae]